MEESASPPVSSSSASDNDPNADHEGAWNSSQQAPNVPSTTTTDHARKMSGSPKAVATMPKRRRVTRACDECRRKKIKCDGKHPCTHCTVYSYECSYDQPSNRRRNPAPQYVEALEKRLNKAEAVLKNVLPNVNLDDPMYASMASQQTPIKQEGGFRTDGLAAGVGHAPSGLHPDGESEKDSVLESMVHEAGSLDLDDQGHWDFYGQSSGMVFLRRMREQFGDILGTTEGTGRRFTKSTNISSRLSSPPTSASGSPTESTLPNTRDLPAKECARKLCSCSLDDAASLMRFVHQPSFYAMFDRIYDTPSEQFTVTDQKFLPLLYAALALGCLFAKAEESMLQSYGYESAMDQGFNWFQTSRQLMDVTDCRDLTSLQALLFMIMFLQASAKLSTCYSHIGIALRSAVRMGLHRSVPNHFTPIEQETRKRTFWTIKNMDTYVGSLLGLPLMLSHEDIDQEMPLEVDDDCITEKEVLPMAPGKTSLMAAFNAHIKLVNVLAKTVKYVYPLHTMHSKSKLGYVVSHAKIREVEQDLQKWMESLPMGLRPGGEAPAELVRVQQLLRLSYGHIQIVLYRPFLHYASPSTQALTADKRTYACAAACISVARNVIHITSEMKKKGLLTGAYWFTMYTCFFAILSLVFYAIENAQNATSEDILRDAHEGRDTLASLAPRSMAADRSTQTLARLFEQLPEVLRTGRQQRNVPVQQKKRSASMRTPGKQEMQPSPSLKSIPSNTSAVADWSGAPSGVSNAQWKSGATAYNSPAMPRPLASSLNTTMQEGPSQTYNAATPGPLGFQQSPPSSNLPSNNATSAMFSPFLSSVGPGFPTVSNMMFPSNDPFAYPNQPMTALENYQGGGEHNPAFDTRSFHNVSNGESYGDFNAPLYGQLPSFPVSGTRRASTMADSHLDGQSMGVDGIPIRSQQGRMGVPPLGSNWDAMFGEDWSGAWTDQGFGQ
ncbi:MAG: hypothetical protein Q9183_001042 [Haloplaca sp. 2 TL-2023]